MPLYEYQCDNCGQRFEVMQKFADEPLTRHEACGSGPVHRLISAPAFQFKGSGWYVTDYAKGSSSNQSSNNDSGKNAKSESPSSGSGDKAGGADSGSKSSTPATPSTASSGSSSKD